MPTKAVFAPARAAATAWFRSLAARDHDQVVPEHRLPGPRQAGHAGHHVLVDAADHGHGGASRHGSHRALTWPDGTVPEWWARRGVVTRGGDIGRTVLPDRLSRATPRHRMVYWRDERHHPRPAGGGRYRCPRDGGLRRPAPHAPAPAGRLPGRHGRDPGPARHPTAGREGLGQAGGRRSPTSWTAHRRLRDPSRRRGHLAGTRLTDHRGDRAPDARATTRWRVPGTS